MELTQKDRRDLIDSIARQLIDKAEFDIDELVYLPVAFVAQAAGISPTQVGRVLPVTSFGERNQRVALTALRKYIAENTIHPSGKKPLVTSKSV